MSESKPRARSWRDVRAEAVETGRISEDGIAAARVGHGEQERAHLLRQIRRDRMLSQVELAEAMHVSQPRVSAIERGDLAHTELATLRAYVEALGGALLVTAVFGEEHLLLVEGPTKPGRTRKDSTQVAEQTTPKKSTPKRTARAARVS
jgi:transcriptional regulator with XRE-family HTH domain